MKLSIAQVIGLNTDQKAAQVISDVREEDTFFAVLDLTSDDAFTRGRQALSEASDFYFDFEGTVSERLTATYDEAQKKFTTDEFSILLSGVANKVLYLIGKGGIEVYLKRSEKLSSLLSVGAPNQLISGFLNEDDRLLFATQSLIAFLGEDLAKSLSLAPSDFEEEVKDRIGASNLENQGLAALFVDIEQEELELPNLQKDKSPSPINQPTDINFTDEQPLVYQDAISESISDNSKAHPILIFKKILKKSLGFLWQQKKFFPKSGRGRLIVAVILIVVIALGVGFKVKASKDIKTQAEFNQAILAAKEDFNSAKGLATLNSSEAKSKLDSAKDKVNKAISLKPKDNNAQDLKKQIEGESASILLQSSVSDFPRFYDMDLVKKNLRASQMSMSSGKLLLLDPAAKTLVAVDVSKKSNQILAGSEQLGDASFASLNGGLAFIYSKDKGIVRIDITNQKITTVSKKDEEWGAIIDIYSFAGNVYLLDSNKNQIWKYLPTADSYSDKREYLNKNTKVDFTNALRMQIESSVYVLKNGGEILRFTRGDKDNFSYGGLDKGVKDPKSFFVSSDTDNLYLLDSGNSRLLILTKTGAYKGQVTGSKFAESSDLVVDEKGKKVYLLDGSKIFQVDLK